MFPTIKSVHKMTKKRRTHHFLLVDRKTPIRFNNHGAQPHIFWMSALILKRKQQCQTGWGNKAQLTKRLTKHRSHSLPGQGRLYRALVKNCSLARIGSEASTAAVCKSLCSTSHQDGANALNNWQCKWNFILNYIIRISKDYVHNQSICCRITTLQIAFL